MKTFTIALAESAGYTLVLIYELGWKNYSTDVWRLHSYWHGEFHDTKWPCDPGLLLPKQVTINADGGESWGPCGRHFTSDVCKIVASRQQRGVINFYYYRVATKVSLFL